MRTGISHRRLRLKYGLLPDTEAIFEEADGCVAIRPAISKRTRIEARLLRARGVSDGGLDTAAAMQLTRVEE